MGWVPLSLPPKTYSSVPVVACDAWDGRGWSLLVRFKSRFQDSGLICGRFRFPDWDLQIPNCCHLCGREQSWPCSHRGKEPSQGAKSHRRGPCWFPAFLPRLPNRHLIPGPLPSLSHNLCERYKPMNNLQPALLLPGGMSLPLSFLPESLLHLLLSASFPEFLPFASGL